MAPVPGPSGGTLRRWLAPLLALLAFAAAPTHAADVLLVDDDRAGTDVRGAYTRALEALGVDYTVFDTGNEPSASTDDNEPGAADLAGHHTVIWFSGDVFGNGSSGPAGPGDAAQTALEGHLDGGGCLILSSQDFLYDKARGDTETAAPNPFMIERLGLEAGLHDADQLTVYPTGPTFDLGPFDLDFSQPEVAMLENYSDALTPDASAFAVLDGDQGSVGIGKRTTGWRTLFLAFPWEALPGEAARIQVMRRMLQYCGVLRGTLLVDDNDIEPEQVRPLYENALGSLEIPFAVWDVQAEVGEPDAAVLTGFTDVVWFSADGGPDEFSDEDLGAWLDGGGNLVLFAHDYYFDRGLTVLMTDYLGLADVALEIDYPAITGNGDFAPLGTVALLDLPFKDVFSIDASAEAVLTSVEGVAGVRKQTDRYRSHFFGFQLEAIEDPQVQADLLNLALQTAAGTGPELTSHASGATLGGTSVAFTWNANGVAVDGWALWFGSAAGGSQYGTVLLNTAATTSTTFSKLPYAGETVHVTLFWRVNGVFSTRNSQRYTFTAFTATKPALTGPEDTGDGDAVIGALEALPGVSATFTWNDGGTPVEDHAIWFGSAPGGLDYGFVWAKSASDDPLLFDRLPYSGETVHVTFYWKVRGVWSSRAYTFKAVTLSAPQLTSHADGAALTAPVATFAWSDNGVPVEDHAIWFGSTPGGLQYGFVWAQNATATELEFNKLPLTAAVVHATFYWKVRGVWSSRPYTFTTGGAALPALSSTDVEGGVFAPGAVFTGASATFGWDDAGLVVQDHAIWFGSKPGGLDYGYVWAQSPSGAPLTFAGLPYKGEAVHVTFWWQINGVWSQRAYLARAATLADPELTAPEDPTDADSVITTGEQLPGASADFAWDDHGVPVEDHAVWFGTVPGQLQYGFVWAQSPSDDPLTFARLPTNGATVHATFWWQVRGVWSSRRYVFTAAPGP